MLGFSRWTNAAFVVISLTILSTSAQACSQGQVRPGDSPSSQVFIPGQYGVTPPRLVRPIIADYSEQARTAKFQGFCIVQLIVDSKGNPKDVHVLKPIGMGLDENAVTAARRARFEPGTYNGKPVAVRLSVKVNFSHSPASLAKK